MHHRVWRLWGALLAALFVALPQLAFGQGATVYQNGNAVPDHIAKFVTNGRIADVGGLLGDAAGKGLSPFGITDKNALGTCWNSDLTSNPYNALCLGHDASGNALITVDSYNGLGEKALNIRHNGETVPIGGGTVPSPWTVTKSVVSIGPSLSANALDIAMGGASGPPFQVTEHGQLLVGDLQATYPWLTCSGRSVDQCGTSGNGYFGAPLLRFNGDGIMGDIGKFGGADSRANNVGQIFGWATSGAIPTPTFIFSSENPQADGGTGGSQIQLMPDSTNCCGPGPYRAGFIVAVALPGTGYAKGEEITLTSPSATSAGMQAVAKVLEVGSGGAVASAYILKGGAYTAPASGNLTMTQTSSTGGGTGATFSVEFGQPFLAGTQGSLQYLAQNSFPGGRQRHRFFGRSGPNTVDVLADITDQGINDFGHLHVSGANKFDAASTTILENVGGVARLIADGPDNANVGIFSLNQKRADGSNTITALSTTQMGNVVLNSGALHVWGPNDFVTGNSVILDEAAGLGRLTSVGPNAATNGTFALNSARSDSSNPLTVLAVDAAGNVGMPQALSVNAGISNNGVLLVSATAPTIASGGCTTGSAQSISASNGSAAFEVTLGGATCGSTITLTMPAAAHNWVCDAHNITTPASNVLDMTGAASPTVVVLTNFVRTTGVAGNFTGANKLAVKCTPY